MHLCHELPAWYHINEKLAAITLRMASAWLTPTKYSQLPT
jgi:hypothetical protein